MPPRSDSPPAAATTAGSRRAQATRQTQTAAAEPIGGDWTISNWPLYIDKQTVSDFDQKVGANTKYIEDINDNFEFFGKLQPQLKNGESGGRSMFVVTDYMVKIMHDLGYLQNFDKSALPNVEENLLPSLESPDFDPNRDFSVPWQSGFTGIIINTDLAPEIDSIEDLFDPKYKGKVTFLGDMYDDVTLVLKMDGVDPANATEEEWMKAIDQIDEAANSGQIRDFTGNAYAGPLVKGDLVAAVGWSGDAIQLQADNPNIKWIRPAEGCNLWSDNMVIPVGAPNPDRGTGVHELRLRPQEPGPDRGVRELRHAGGRDQGDPGEEGSEAGQQPADLPRRAVHRRLHAAGGPDPVVRGQGHGGVPVGDHRLRRRPAEESLAATDGVMRSSAP